AMTAIQADPPGPNTMLALTNAGQAALWLRDPGRLQQVVHIGQDASGFWSSSGRQAIRALDAALAAVRGDHDEAVLAYDSLLATRLSTGHRFAHAVLTVDAVSVLPPGLVPEGAIETARPFLEERGAVPLLARLDASVQASTEIASR
ncbi:MAG: hypothetical protein WCA29_00880, partial [Jiangellales bacterium]